MEVVKLIIYVPINYRLVLLVLLAYLPFLHLLCKQWHADYIWFQIIFMCVTSVSYANDKSFLLANLLLVGFPLPLHTIIQESYLTYKVGQQIKPRTRTHRKLSKLEKNHHIDSSIWGSVVQSLGGSCDREHPALNHLPSPSFAWCSRCSLWKTCREVHGSLVPWASWQWCKASIWGAQSNSPIAIRWQGLVEQPEAEQRRPWQKDGLEKTKGAWYNKYYLSTCSRRCFFFPSTYISLQILWWS